MAFEPRNLDELRALSRGPIGIDHLYQQDNGGPWILLSAGLLDALWGAEDGDRIRSWLRAQSCPVLGLTAAMSEPVRDLACDVLVSTDRDLETIQRNIQRSPIAARFLVQELRLTQALPIEDALTVESLTYSALQAGPEFKRWLATRAAPASSPPGEGPAVLVARDGETVSIRLNRPASRNAISVEVRDALCEALELLVADPTIRSASIAGGGKCFSVGGDLTEFGTAPDPATAHAIRTVRSPARLLAQCADRVEFQLHGACIGAGAELPAFGHRVTAHKSAFFQLPELAFGLIPGAGGTVSLPRRIGRQRTVYLALSGKRISARTALEWGLIDRLSD